MTVRAEGLQRAAVRTRFYSRRNKMSLRRQQRTSGPSEPGVGERKRLGWKFTGACFLIACSLELTDLCVAVGTNLALVCVKAYLLLTPILT